ncbi:MAG TPA: hypothetical protein VI072_05965 [Polyangiaceae bacterium]
MLAKARTQLNQVERLVNWVSDNDREWWPFLFLRPREHERMGSRRVLALAVLHGFFAGMLANAVLALTAGPGGPGVSIWMFPVWTTLVFFVLYRSTFAYFWNRRAQRLTGASIAGSARQ